MREIKFRAWSNELNKMVYPDDKGWFHSCFVGENGLYQTCQLGIAINLNGTKLELMQFTGLKDKNGKEIYEGDIVKWHDIVKSIYTVTFTDGVFCLDEMPDSNFWHHREEIGKKFEVIGNIYENKELLNTVE